jgi:hypothetical protein
MTHTFMFRKAAANLHQEAGARNSCQALPSAPRLVKNISCKCCQHRLQGKKATDWVAEEFTFFSVLE